MRRLLAFADVVDRLTESFGQWLKWLVLFSSVISAFNALMRYTIHYSSNAWLEIPMVVNSIKIWEHSSDPGGLLRWPIKIMIPLGFLCLTVQGVAEIIK